ncbi:MAG: YraN family protein [Woeseiaceae bacterium]|nr:YraN family protein [Woeseiaceae bacterium]
MGFDAEQLVLRHLRSKGLRPVTRNYRTRRGEIDLIMLDKDCLTFIEVRYRTSGSFVDARFTVDARKQKKIGTTAQMFLARNAKFQNHTCRFDVVGVDRDPSGRVTIDWLQDAFRPTG